jgi:hypothetical protein
MDIHQPRPHLGAHVLGLGVAAMALAALIWGKLDGGQPLPASLPGRTAIADAVALFMLAAGGTLLWRRTRAWGAAALTTYYALIVVLLLNGRVVIAHHAEFQAYNGAAEQLAIPAAALVVYAAAARIDAARAALLTRLGQIVFGLCAIVFGGAHFVYMNLTAPLVPAWIPPSQLFWGFATGVAHIAGGAAIAAGIRARLAAILLTAMYAIFSLLVHLPLAFADPASHFVWAENALNLTLIGCAWVMADSFARAPK